jgi:hypothetical protein
MTVATSPRATVGSQVPALCPLERSARKAVGKSSALWASRIPAAWLILSRSTRVEVSWAVNFRASETTRMFDRREGRISLAKARERVAVQSTVMLPWAARTHFLRREPRAKTLNLASPSDKIRLEPRTCATEDLVRLHQARVDTIVEAKYQRSIG